MKKELIDQIIDNVLDDISYRIGHEINRLDDEKLWSLWSIKYYLDFNHEI